MPGVGGVRSGPAFAAAPGDGGSRASPGCPLAETSLLRKIPGSGQARFEVQAQFESVSCQAPWVLWLRRRGCWSCRCRINVGVCISTAVVNASRTPNSAWPVNVPRRDLCGPGDPYAGSDAKPKSCNGHCLQSGDFSSSCKILIRPICRGCRSFEQVPF